MAKKPTFSFKNFDLAAFKNTEAYAKAVDALYNEALKEFAKVAGNVQYNPSKPFSFSDYPQARQKVQQIIAGLTGKMKAVIKDGSEKNWLFACKKNDAFIEHIMDTAKLSKDALSKYQDKNLEALDAFQNRKVNGIDLSKRIWNYTGQMKDQMELGIDIALGDGKSAQELSRDLRQYLVDPDKLFRRVRDKYGNLKLSKAAKAYHPGQGKYRSSYKNAMRLTRTEINMAYRSSDQIRCEQLDFVLGYEIKLSNNHTLNGKSFVDICDRLAGKYPKTFKWNGWHPQCRCYRVNILMDNDEFNTDELNELKAAINGTEYKKFVSKDTIIEVPDNFKSWINENKERAKNWKSQPYFIQDNYLGGKIEGGLIHTDVAQKVVFKNNNYKIKGSLPEVSKLIDRSGYKPEFVRGFVEVLENSSNVNFMSTNSKGTIYISNKTFEIEGQQFNPLESIKSAIGKIRKGEELTFNEEYSIEGLWHEINHNRAKKYKTFSVNETLERQFMEMANQWYSRQTYDDFLFKIGGKAIHQDAIIKNGYGYNKIVKKFSILIEESKIDEKDFVSTIGDILLNKNYQYIIENIFEGIIKYANIPTEEIKIKIASLFD